MKFQRRLTIMQRRSEPLVFDEGPGNPRGLMADPLTHLGDNSPNRGVCFGTGRSRLPALAAVVAAELESVNSNSRVKIGNRAATQDDQVDSR